MTVHEAAWNGFEQAGSTYERGRPSYPAEAITILVQELGLCSGTVLVELGAGTGKLTRLLSPTGAHITAVEPVSGMRAIFSQELPDVDLRDGTAESIPFAADAVDAVVVGQAFHWFRGDDALREIHRVLRPDGRLGLIWNARDTTVDWVARLTEIIDRYEADTPRYATGRWRAAFDGTSLFSPLQERQFSYIQKGDAQTIVARVTSISFIATLPETERARVAEDVVRLLRTHPQTRGQEIYVLPYRTDVYWCAKKAGVGAE